MPLPISPMDRKLDSHLAKPSTGRLHLFAAFAFFCSLAYTLASLASYYFSAGGSFAFFRVPRMSPVFADLRQLTHSSSCGSSFWELLANTSNCDPFQRPFNYTWPSLQLLRSLGIGAEGTELTGALFGVFGLIAVSVFVFALTKGRTKGLLIATAFIMSFPFQLAIERGNHDVIVFGVCLFVPLLLFPPEGFGGQTAKAITASALAFSAVALKVFPLVGLAPWSFGLAIRWPDRRAKWIPILILVMSCLGVLIQIGDLSQIMANTPKPDGGTSFGFLASYQSRLGGMMAMILTAFKAAVVVFIAYILRSDRFDGLFAGSQDDQRLESSRQAALMFSCMILVTWLVSRSWDYRLVICLGVVPYFANIFDNASPALKTPKTSICLGTFFLFYEQYVGGRIGVVSDALVQPALIGFILSFLLRSRKTWLASG